MQQDIRFNNILEILEKKYGKYIVNILVDSDGFIDLSAVKNQKSSEQEIVKKILKNLKINNDEDLIPDNFHIDKIEWGVDFSSWFGTLKSKKKFMFIGAEPHIVNKFNYQTVYGLGVNKEEGVSLNKMLEKSAIQIYSRDDIWKNLTNIFVDDLTCENIISFLSQCYITDLCHIAPKGFGQVKGILNEINKYNIENNKLDSNHWEKFRSNIAENFLFNEIKAVNPEIIILHGNASRNFFKKNVSDCNFSKEEHIIEGTKYKILNGTINIGRELPIISIPHLKGQMRTMLWNNKKNDFEKFKSAKEIIRSLIEIEM